MKFGSFLIIFFILLKQISAGCYKSINSLKDSPRIEEVGCGEWVTENKKNNDDDKLVEGSETMFQIVFKCLLTNQNVLCDKVQRTFDNAGKRISSALKLKEKVVVNATLLDLCEGKSDLECPLEIRRILGSTTSTKFYSLLDDDGLERLYPQALVKQYQLTEHPKYDDFDIETMFNSRNPLHFSDDTTPFVEPQVDFEYVVTHELIHGLGFASSWQPLPIDGPVVALLPQVVALNNGADGNVEPTNPNEPITVKETAFDKYMIRLDNGTFISEYTKIIGRYFLDNRITAGSDIPDGFGQSYQFQLMSEMLRLGTTPQSLGFLPHNSNNYSADAVKLETSIVPFQPGSSISHVDALTYNNTSDFLMMFRANHVKTLDQLILIGGNYSGGAIGPKLKLVLETIGYATDDYQNPYQPQPFVKPQSKPSKSSSSKPSPEFSVFSQFCIMISIIVVLL